MHALTSQERTQPASPSLSANPAGVSARFIYVLEHDPELAAGLSADDSRLARRFAAAPVVDHPCGDYAFFPQHEPGALGALIVDGVIVVRTGGGARGHIEVMAGGDVISPWVTDDGNFTTAPEVTACVVRPARFAFLDRGFITRIARWPELYAALAHRLVLRARRLSLQAAVNAVPRIDARIEMTFWHLADRLGRVTPDGVLLDLPLTHAQLAELVGAQRPSVTSALSRLVREQRVDRAARQRWLLCGDTPDELDRLRRQAGLVH